MLGTRLRRNIKSQSPYKNDMDTVSGDSERDCSRLTYQVQRQFAFNIVRKVTCRHDSALFKQDVEKYKVFTVCCRLLWLIERVNNDVDYFASIDRPSRLTRFESQTTVSGGGDKYSGHSSREELFRDR